MKQANIEWRDGQPFSLDFDDVYFSRKGGIEETEYVFLKQNGLPELWQDKDQFVIAETGFGTGLNLLTTIKHWLASSKNNAKLYYYSVEKFPLSKQDLQKALSVWPAFDDLTEELIKHYPSAVSGFHRFHLLKDKIIITLMFGDIENMLGQLDANVDAWYLDGFSPDKNPQMWTDSVFQQIARCSYENTTLSTFTAAGFVRRGLSNVGFNVSKIKGFGKKREMLSGWMEKRKPFQYQQPWFDIPENTHEQHAVIIGGGIAGITTAQALAAKGWTVELIEKHNDVAQEASGNPAGVLMPRLSLDDSVEGEFYAAAYCAALSAILNLDEVDDFNWHQDGVLQLASSERIKKQIEQLECDHEFAQVVSAEKASELCGLDIKHKAIFFPKSAWLSPVALCKNLLSSINNKVLTRFDSKIKNIKRVDDEWLLFDENDHFITKSNVVVLANASAAKELRQTAWLALQYVRGQISYLKANDKSKSISIPVCYDGYIIPALNNQHVVGATFKPIENSIETTAQDHEENLQHLNQWLPNIFDENINDIEGRAALRAVTPDRLPLVGPVSDIEFLSKTYGDLKKGKPDDSYPTAEYFPGLYVNVGHGARGLTSAFLAAELLASQIENTPSPVPTRVKNALHPSRFIIRALKKGKFFKQKTGSPGDEHSAVI